MKRLLPLVVLLAHTLSAYAQRDVAHYERLLLPILPSDSSTPGAFGAQWETRLWMANDADVPVDAFPLSRDCVGSFGCITSIREAPAFAGKGVGYDLLHARPFDVGIPKGSTAGGFLYVERSGADQFSFQLHVRDTSRGTQTFGTRIPVVRERDFLTGTRDILAVPLNAGGRTALRIYAATPGAITLRIEETTGHYENVILKPPARFVETRLDFNDDAAMDPCTFFFSGCPPVQYKPATIEITDLVQRFPELQDSDSRNGVRIEIEPITPGLSYWPMVTVTSNLTNEVTLFLAR